MADFIHTTNSEIDGPFLLDRSQLEALDQALNDEWVRFEEEYNRTLKEAIEKLFNKERTQSWNKDRSDAELRAAARLELERSFEFRKGRQFSIILKNESIAKVQDFAASFREPDLQDKDPSGFVVSMESAGRKCCVTLRGDRPRLEVSVEPKGDYLVQQTFTILKTWQNSVRPPLWQALWHQWSFVVCLTWFFVVLLSIPIIDRQRESSLKAEYKQQALSLVTNGVSSDKQGKAMELLLANAYNLSPNKPIPAFPNWFYLLLFGGFAYCILLSIKPNVALAIGLGERKVRIWRKYSNIVLITTPSFIFLTFFWPKIEAILKSWF